MPASAHRRNVVVIASLGFSALLAHAELPGVLDRVPAGSPMVAVTREVAATFNKAQAMVELVGGDTQSGFLAQLRAIVEAPGVNRAGSAAVVMLRTSPQAAAQPPAEQDPEETVIALVPVSDYAAFVGGFGGDAAKPATSLPKASEDLYAKNIGQGYAAVGMSEELVSSFSPAGGQLPSHAGALRPAVTRLAEESDFFVLMHSDWFGPHLKAGREQLEGQAQMLAGMPGQEQAAQQIRTMAGMMDAFGRDAQVVGLGLQLGDQGVRGEAVTQFKEGSPAALLCTMTGRSAELLKKVPAMPYLLAGAIDMSSPAMKEITRQQLEQARAMGPNPFMDAITGSGLVDLADGQAWVMGSSPAPLATGLFARTVMYVSSKDPAAYTKGYAALLGSMKDGVKVQDIMTYSATHSPAASKIGETSLDAWTMQVQMIPPAPPKPGEQPDEQAQQRMMQQMMTQQVMGMVMGPSGTLAGYFAPTKDGAVFTMSQDTTLATTALAAAQDGTNTLAQDSVFIQTASRLPAGRVGEAYLSVGGVVDSVGGMLAMFTGQAIPRPEQPLPPVGMCLTTDAGSAGFHLYVPSSVISWVTKTAKAMAPRMQQMEQMHEGGEEPLENRTMR